jgi:hypothetical protein
MGISADCLGQTCTGVGSLFAESTDMLWHHPFIVVTSALKQTHDV